MSSAPRTCPDPVVQLIGSGTVPCGTSRENSQLWKVSENDAVSIAVAKELLLSSTVIREVFLTNKNFGCLVEALEKIEADQKLESVLTVLEFVKINLEDPIAAEKFRKETPDFRF